MKTISVLIIIIMVSTTSLAQETNEHNASEQQANDTYIHYTMTPDTSKIQSVYNDNRYGQNRIIAPLSYNIHNDSLQLPHISSYGQILPLNIYPINHCGCYNWQLHKGLNINIGAAVFAQIGKHANHGVGFSQSIAAMYAFPITSDLSLAVGGYFNNTMWSHDSYHDGGLTAVIGYNFNEHWEAFIYGQKSFVDKHHLPYYLYDITHAGDRLGAALKYNFNKNASIQISIEGNSRPKQKIMIVEQQLPKTLYH